MRRVNWKDFFAILGIALMYLIGGMTIAIGSLIISTNDGYHWFVWVYRIVGPISMSIFLLMTMFAFEVLIEGYHRKKFGHK